MGLRRNQNLNLLKKFYSLYTPLFVLCVFLILVGLVFVIRYGQTQGPEDVVFHGPHRDTLVASVTRTRLSSSQNKGWQRKVFQPITSVITNSLTTTPSDPTSPQSVPLRDNNGYGIAAGGGLVYFGQNDLDTYFASLKALGVTWVRWDIDWSVVQSDNANTYNWQGPDRVVTTATKYGINSLGIITYAPKWAQDPNKSCASGQRCPPLDPAVFAHFAGVAAARYKATINTWEIWNEPNYEVFWSPRANAASYSAFLKASYTEIKNVNSNAIVLAGGLAAAGDAGGNISPDTFIRTLYASGAQNYFDDIALHPYTYPASPDYVALWNSWQQINSVRQIMISNGDSAKKIWVTEYGAPTGGSGTVHDLNQLTFTYGSDYMSELAQQQLLQGVMALYGQDKSWMGPFFWYSLKDEGTSNSTPENFFGLLRYDGSHKPAYDTLKSIIASGI